MEHPPQFWSPEKALAEYVREQASWRRSKAEQFPEDVRNARSAIALERLAVWIEDELPTDDRRLLQLIELGSFTDGRFVAGEEARRAIASWGFDHDETDLRRFRDLLQELVATTRRARRDPAQKRKAKMTVSTATRTSGADHELTDAECDVLTDIFELAQRHSHECLEKERAFRDAIASIPLPWNWTDLLNEYTYAVAHLHAAIALAALARVPILAPLEDRAGEIAALTGAQLEQFLRPIFDEAGIGDSFVGPPHAGIEGRVDHVEELDLLRQATHVGSLTRPPSGAAMQAWSKLGELGFTFFENAFQRAERMAAGRPPRLLHELDLARLSGEELDRLRDRGIEEADEELQRRTAGVATLTDGARARLTPILRRVQTALESDPPQLDIAETALLAAQSLAAGVAPFRVRVDAALRSVRHPGIAESVELRGQANDAIRTMLRDLEPER